MQRHTRPAPRPSARPRLEALDDRIAPALFNPTFDTSVNVGVSPQLVVLGKFGGGQPLDLATTNQASNTVSVRNGTGSASFAGATTVNTNGVAPEGLVAGRFHGPAAPLDLAVANSFGAGTAFPPVLDGTVSILTGDGAGGFTRFTPGTPIVIPRPAGGTNVLLTYIEAGAFHGPNGNQDLAVADFNNGTVTILNGQGNGTFTVGQQLTGVGSPNQITAADLDGDGRLDLAVADSSNDVIRVFRGNGDGTFAFVTTFGTGGRPVQVAAADLDGGGPDLVVTNNTGNTVTVLHNTTAGFGTAAPGAINFASTAADTYAVGAAPVGLAATDLNGDGAADLLVANSMSGTVSILVGNGDGTFLPQPAVSTGAGSQPIGLAVGDVNGDGLKDLVVIDQAAAQVKVFTNQLVPTTLALAAPAAAAGGQPVALTATLTAANAAAINTGRVTFFDGDRVLGTAPVAGNTATLTAPLAAGARSVRAVYADSVASLRFSGATATRAVAVTPATITIDPATLPGGAVGRAYTQTLTAAGAPGPFAFTVTAGALPPGLSLAANGALTGTPTRAGTFAFTVTAANAFGTGTRAYTLAVSGAASGPVLVGGRADGTAVVFTPGADGKLTAGDTINFGLGGSVRTATADVTGDGVPDFVGGAGPGGAPRVVVIDGATGKTVADFLAFEATFTGGVYVTAADLDGDGMAEVIVTPDRGGGPVVALYSGDRLTAGEGDGAEIIRFFGIDDPNFRGGCRAALGDVNGDGVPDLVVSAGFLGGPRIALFNGRDVAAGAAAPGRLVADFFAFEETVRNGAFLTAGDVTGDGVADLAFGGGPTGAPRVRVVDGRKLLAAGGFSSLDQVADAVQVGNFFAGDSSLRGGVRVSLRDADGDGRADVVTGSGDGEASRVRVYGAVKLVAGDATPAQELDPFGGVLTNGVFVG